MNATPAPRPPASRLEEALRARRFVITTEIAPPVSFDPQDLLAKALPLKGLADAVNVTDGASARAHLSAPIAAALLVQHGIEPILQFTCRDRNRIALQADLMGAAATGVHNLLTLTGDDPKAGDQPETKPVFDIDSTTLTAMARRMGEQGELPTGRKIAGRASFFIGAADAPIDPPPGWQPDEARRQDRGRRAVRPDPVLHGCGRSCAATPSGSPPTRRRAIFALIVGIAPLRSAKSARWMKEHLWGTIIPDDFLARLDAAADPGRGGSAHLPRADRGVRRASPASPGCTSWRRRTKPRCRR